MFMLCTCEDFMWFPKPFLAIMGYSRKNPHPHATEGMLENLAGGGVNSSGNSAGGWLWT